MTTTPDPSEPLPPGDPIPSDPVPGNPDPTIVPSGDPQMEVRP